MPLPTSQPSHANNTRRSSKLPEFFHAGLRRNRTTSLPPKSRARDSKHTKALDAPDTTLDSIDSSLTNGSVTSVTDPFAPQLSQSSSFVHLHHHSILHPMSHPQSHTTGSTSFVTSSTPKRRGSILVAASDALSSLAHLGRRKRPPICPPTATPPTPILLSEVIEISPQAARRHEAEDQERERLRDVAAQSLGLGPVLLEDALSRLDSGEMAMGNGDSDHSDLDDDDDDDRDRPPESDITGFPSVSVTVPMPPPPPPSLPPLSTGPGTGTAALSSPSPPPPILPPSISSSAIPPSMMPYSSRARSGSVARSHHSHSNSYTTRANSTTPSPSAALPAFPTTYSSIKNFSQRIAMLPKHYPPPSLLMFALAKQWKNRFIVLTTPSMSPFASSFSSSSSSQQLLYQQQQAQTYHSSSGNHPSGRVMTPTPSSLKAGSGPSVSYLHLFKSSGDEEKEVERLEINEESVVFVTDEEVGGRRSVVKVGGVDVGALKREWNHEEDGKTMWLLQILDASEAQCWIEAIKTAVLSQRSLRAGLGAVSHNTGGVEPRGDLDVMLSMRAQGLFPSNSETTSPTATPRVQSPISLSPTSPSHSTFGGNGGVPNANDTSLSPPSTLSRSHSRAANNGSAGGSNANGTTSVQSTPKIQNAAVSALKGLFSSNRPRSPSAVSTLSEADPTETPTTTATAGMNVHSDESFGSVGANLLMLRSNSISSENRFSSPTSPTFSTSSPSTPSTPRMQQQFQPPHQQQQQQLQQQPQPQYSSPTGAEGKLLDRKIIRDGDRQLLQLGEWAPTTGPFNTRASFMIRESEVLPSSLTSFSPSGGGTTNGGGTGSPSLQPPPRRRAWTSSGPGSGNSKESELRNGYSYSHANGSTAESLGVKHPHPPPPPLPQQQQQQQQLNGNGTLSPSFMNTTEGLKGKDRKVRTSWSSVSSQASGEVTPSADQHSGTSNGHGSKRWSRHGTFSHRLTPPSGSPNPNTPQTQTQTPRNSMSRHPYAAERPPSRSSSLRSSPQSLVLDLRPLSPKRTSGSSVQSFNTGSSHSRSPGLFSQRSVSAHRISIPPPQRPVPISALPPTPGQELGSSLSLGLSVSTPTPHPHPPPPHTNSNSMNSNSTPSSPSRHHPSSAPAAKTSFRDTLTLRAHRLSLSPPTLPPSSTLPPRPDEPGYRTESGYRSTTGTMGHRRTSSNGSANGVGINGMGLATIPASPPPPTFESPYPPPNGPLPPTPIFSSGGPAANYSSSSTVTTTTTAPTPTRPSLSIKRRLRILSAPSPSPPSTPDLNGSGSSSFSSGSPSPFDTHFHHHHHHNRHNHHDQQYREQQHSQQQQHYYPQTHTPPLNIFTHDHSLPPTPIGEPITTLQNDPNFLLMSPPTPPPSLSGKITPTLINNNSTTITTTTAPMTATTSTTVTMSTTTSGTMVNPNRGSVSMGLRPLFPPPPPPPEMTTLDHDAPSITSLSPPPRRGSRRVSTPDKEKLMKGGLGLGLGLGIGIGNELGLGNGTGLVNGNGSGASLSGGGNENENENGGGSVSASEGGLVEVLAPLKDDFIKSGGDVEFQRGLGIGGRREDGEDSDELRGANADGGGRNGSNGGGGPAIQVHEPPEPLHEEDEDIVDPERDHDYDHDHEREDHEEEELGDEEEQEKSGILSSAASAFGLGLDSPKTRPLDHRCAVSLVDVSL